MRVHTNAIHGRLGMIRFVSALLCLLLSAGTAAQTREVGWLAEGTPWQTPVILIDSGEPGPTVMVVGGMHGNEPAGARAAEQIADWPVLRGRLVVVPRANQLGLDAATRRTPDGENPAFDLNRAFPVGAEPDHVLAAGIWELVESCEPDWLIDLHEGYDFHRQNSDSVGASLIFTRGEADVDSSAQDMLARVNASIELPERRFVALSRSGPVHGSLANAAEERSIHAMILETCYKDQRLPLRTRQHRLMMYRLLTRLEMVPPDAVCQIAPIEGQVLRIALYDDTGVGGSGRRKIEKIMGPAGCILRRIDAVDVHAGALSQFDILICTGGSGSGQARSLGEAGRERVRAFVRDGGGYVGICAGAYLATSGYSWSLAIIDATHLHSGSGWRRGRGGVEIEWTESGLELFGSDALGRGGMPLAEQNEVFYANGPIVGPAGRDDLADYMVVAWFRSEITEHDAQPGLMVDTPAIICGAFGDGRVVSISPHPEATEGFESMVRNAVLWTCAMTVTD